MQATMRLNRPQADFLALPQQFCAFVSGYGGGKTWVACCGLGLHFSAFPGVDAGYFAPTYPHIRDIFYPTVEECFEGFGLRVDVKLADREVVVFNGRRKIGVVRCRSMDRPETIVGFKIGRAVADEIDVLPTQKATTAWRKIIARMRYNVPGLPNRVDVTTTPEGFGFAHEHFVRRVRESVELKCLYGIIQASTYDNEKNLPEGYIASLLQSYPTNLVEAYINGQFVNLKTGSIYVAYDRKRNGSTEIVADGENVHVGMDFNVGKMAAIVHVMRGGNVHAVAEIVGAYDTPDMIRRLKEFLWRYEGGTYVPTRQVTIYPDASGESRRSVNASQTDLALLREARFRVSAPAANPPVKDRINAMNTAFCNAEGVRKYYVNVDMCKAYAEALEQQPWAQSGEPDKTTGHDHPNDAGGYFIVQKFPVVRRLPSSHPYDSTR